MNLINILNCITTKSMKIELSRIEKHVSTKEFLKNYKGDMFDLMHRRDFLFYHLHYDGTPHTGNAYIGGFSTYEEEGEADSIGLWNNRQECFAVIDVEKYGANTYLIEIA